MKKKIFYTIINSPAGITLIELMIYVGMLGGVSLLIATLGTNINRSNVVREADLLASEFMQDFQVQMSKKGVCDYNFEGQNSTAVSSAFKYPNQIRNTDGSVLYSVGQELENYFSLTSMSIAKINNTRADIQIDFTRKNSRLNTISAITRKLKLTVVHEADGVTINKCLVSFDQDIGDQLPLICNGEGAILSDSGTPTDVSDDVCIHAGYSMERCPSGEYVQRFELVNIDNGSGKIQPFYRPVCAAIVKPTSLLCPSGEVLLGYSAVEGLICRALVAKDIRNHFLGDYTSCALLQKFPISMVGSNNNIHCGLAIATPTATATATATSTPATPTATPTSKGSTECIEISDPVFAVQIPLLVPLNATPAGKSVVATVSQTQIDGTVKKFTITWDMNGLNARATLSPGNVYNIYGNADQNQNYLYIKNGSNFFTANFEAAFSKNHPSTLGAASCSYLVDVENCSGTFYAPPFTKTDPVTICVDDSSSSVTPMYDHADPFNIL